MKKKILIISGIILFISQLAMAQENSSDFFLGRWNCNVIGTPNGDAKFVLKIEKTEGALAGAIIAEDGKSVKVDRVSTTASSLTVYWFAEGYDVYLTLTKKEDEKVEGSLMDMFTTKVERVVE
ncbi:MAG TPA: hypothetical protein VLQ91_05270 [Draconibacterium sp.]|nr:hypothetical protein [Draconibacterium sp.]